MSSWAVTPSKTTEQSGQPASEGLGIIFALIVLFFAFRRSFLCALLPLISALMAIGVGTSIIGILTHAVAVPQFGPILATLVALGVGIDYALFIVSRHRNGLLGGRTPEDAAVIALNTSGRAVLFAGMTICIALLGMFALQVSFLYGVALSATFVVALTMLASLTLLPAMLGFFGMKALRRGERRRLREAGPQPGAGPGLLAAVGRRSWSGRAGDPERSRRWPSSWCWRCRSSACASGSTDAGNDPPSSTTRQAYDLLAKGFGPGFNGPLQVVGKIDQPGRPRPVRRLRGLTAGPARTWPPWCRPAAAPTARPRWPSSSRRRRPRTPRRPACCTACAAPPPEAEAGTTARTSTSAG